MQEQLDMSSEYLPSKSLTVFVILLLNLAFSLNFCFRSQAIQAYQIRHCIYFQRRNQQVLSDHLIWNEMIIHPV